MVYLRINGLERSFSQSPLFSFAKFTHSYKEYYEKEVIEIVMNLDNTQLHVLLKAIQWRINGITTRLDKTAENSYSAYASEVYVLRGIEDIISNGLVTA